MLHPLANADVRTYNSSVIGKMANLKTGVSRKQSTPNFPKNEHFLPLGTQTLFPIPSENVRFF